LAQRKAKTLTLVQESGKCLNRDRLGHILALLERFSIIGLVDLDVYQI